MGYHHRQNTLIFPICFSIGIISLITAIILIIIAISLETMYLWQAMTGCWYGIIIGVISFGFKYLDINDDEINNQLIVQFGYNLPCFCGLNRICIPYDSIIQYQSIKSKWFYPRGCRKCGQTCYFNAAGYGQNHCCHNGYFGCCLCKDYCNKQSNHDMIYLQLQENNNLKFCIREVMISTNDRENLMELLANKDIVMLQTKNSNDDIDDENIDPTTVTKELETIQMR